MVACSLTFAVNYTIIDMLELTLDFIHNDICRKGKDTFTPLVVSNLQHYFLLVATLVLGLLFGSMYGAVDIEELYEVKFWMFEAAIFIELFVFGPLGMLFGGIIGCLFTIIRIKELEKNRHKMNECTQTSIITLST